jgi:iron(III) transport system substrate-binding protein
MRYRQIVGAAAALGALAASACGDGGEPEHPAAPPPAVSPVGEVVAELEGLTGDERTRALADLAEGEDAQLTFYTALDVDLSGPVVDAFTDAYGVSVDLYRAPSGTVLNRLVDEAAGGFAGADVVLLNGTDMAALDRGGLLQPLSSPALDGLVDGAASRTWATVYSNLFVAAWNTDSVGPGDAPTTWEEVLAGAGGTTAFDVGDFDWFATLVERYFEAERGLSEDEAVDLFRDAAEGARLVDGHTLLGELLAGGDVDVATSAYQHTAVELHAGSEPVAWEPAVEPIVAQPNGAGVTRDADAPASALLLVEFLLTDAQALLAEAGRLPARVAAGDGPAAGYEVVTSDAAALDADRPKWEELYADVLTQGDG